MWEIIWVWPENNVCLFSKNIVMSLLLVPASRPGPLHGIASMSLFVSLSVFLRVPAGAFGPKPVCHEKKSVEP